MSKHALLGLVLAGSMTFLGCEQQEPAVPAQPTPAADAAIDRGVDAAESAADSIDEASAAATERAESATEAATNAATEHAEAAREEAAAGADAAAAAAEDVGQLAEAKTLIQQVQEYLQANKLDLAESTLAKLDGMRDSLPASVQVQIDNLKSLVEAAKSKNQLQDSATGIGDMMK